MLDNVIRLAVQRHMPPPAIDPRLARADWLEAQIDALPAPERAWERADAEDVLVASICVLPDVPDYTTDASPWGPLHSLSMLGISVYAEDSFEAMCRRWVSKARGSARHG